MSALDDRPAILDRLRHPGGRRHAVIEASAGTGKTHALEHLVVDLLREGTPIEQILVVTFTEKATLEMRGRVRARIAALVREGHDELRPALLDFDRAPISTIHAFCQRVLAEHAFVSGRLLEQERIDARTAFERAFRDALRRGLAEGASERPFWLGALASLDASTLEQRLYAWAREPGEVRPCYDEDALAAALSALPTDAEIDGAGGRALLASIAHPASRARTREALFALGPLVARARAGTPVRTLWPDLLAWASEDPHGTEATRIAQLEKALGDDPRLAEHVRTLARHLSCPLLPLVHVVLPEIRARLAEDKARRGGFDFDDMLRLVRDALDGPRGEALVRSLRARYRYALLDEFQDTDPIQWSIFRRIFFDRSEGHALFLIGDPKQSIYAFRSADVHTYHAACAEVLASGGIREPLVDCFRSTAAMIAGLNLLLERGFFTGPNRYEHPVRCGRPDLRALDGEGRPVAPIVLMQLVARDAGAELAAGAMRQALAHAIAEEIERLLGGGLQVSDRSRSDLAPRPLQPSDVFVLTRTGAEAHEVAEVLRRRGLPISLSKHAGIFESREALDVLDVLRALQDPGARAPRLRAWLTPFFGVRVEELDAFRDLDGDHPYLERLVRWATLAREHRWATLFSAMLDESGLARRLLFCRESERALVNYVHVLELLLVRAGQRRLGLHELITELASSVGRPPESEEHLQRLESERAAVQILTMHASKGLEAEVVFLFGGWTARSARKDEPRTFHDGGRRVAWLGPPTPEVKALAQAEEREENERLLYVAMTRARSRLYLPYRGPASGEPRRGHESRRTRPTGTYAVLDERLARLDDQGALRDATTFERRRVVVDECRERRAAGAPAPAVAPPTEPTPIALPEIAPADRFGALKAAARGVVITSYTRMKQGRLPMLADEAERWLEQMQGEAEPAPTDELPGATDDELPGGTAFGLFVHEVLERIDFARVRRAAHGAALLDDPATRALFEEAARRNALDPAVIEPSAELVHRTLRTPIAAGELALPEGFAALDRKVAEMSFLHPIPERAHPPLGQWPGPDQPPLEVERGFVRGVIDLVFEHEGRLWVLDWKTDRLAAYDGATLEHHVQAHYEVQARLYALAAVRMLGIADERDHAARFGGIVYCFVRGMEGPGAAGSRGIHAVRPDLATMRAWDRAMRESDAPWGHPLPPRRGPAPEQSAESGR